MMPMSARVSEELITELRERFPMQIPQIGEDRDRIFHDAGVQYLIQFLEEQYKVQDEMSRIGPS